MCDKREIKTGKMHESWWAFTLQQKIRIFVVVVVLIVLISLAFNAVVVNFALEGFNDILDDNYKSHQFQEAINEEAEAFERYARDESDENRKTFNVACVKTSRCLDALPYNYEQIGADRYMKTWSIKNSYETYEKQRDYILTLKPDEREYIEKLYKVYKMQDYLQVYASRLVQATLKEGNVEYQRKVSTLYMLPLVLTAFSALLIYMIIYLSGIMSHTLVDPVIKLARMTRKIAKSDFSADDVIVENRDEIGELVEAFNKMKHSTERYIATLEEKNEMAVLLHEEELEKLKIEKQLEVIRFEVLRNQINPHFLFNTLNMIACMAKLEDADTTEQMITCMSNLFRYNLKTTEPVVTLEREIKVVKDYMYLQQMRFGSRIKYDIDCDVNAQEVMLPSFTLQPIVENSIIHGLSKKESGGTIHIKVWKNGGNVTVSAADTGLGMTQERLEAVRNALAGVEIENVGIGIGNIYKRFLAMYKNGEFNIYSRYKCGTVVQMIVPHD